MWVISSIVLLVHFLPWKFFWIISMNCLMSIPINSPRSISLGQEQSQSGPKVNDWAAQASPHKRIKAEDQAWYWISCELRPRPMPDDLGAQAQPRGWIKHKLLSRLNQSQVKIEIEAKAWLGSSGFSPQLNQSQAEAEAESITSWSQGRAWCLRSLLDATFELARAWLCFLSWCLVQLLNLGWT